AATTDTVDDAALLHRVLQDEGARRWQIELTEAPLLGAVHEFRAES
ncbi:ribonuclease D, partial [Dietzia sp. DQ11-44]|nr:ribonuclease D [Dietzia sp. DQ11-44]